MGRLRSGWGVLAALTVAAAVSVFGVFGVGGLRAHAGAANAGVVGTIPALPRLGAVQTVDENDVGDPFVSAVPAGTSPPTEVPYQISGPDAYLSARWTPAMARSARAEGWFLLVGTTDWNANIPTAISSDLVHWTQAPDSLPALPRWAAPSISMTWGPSLLPSGSSWVMFFSTEERASRLECIGRAVASSPAGPYVDSSSQPLVCQRALGGSIDPSVVRSKSGLYLVWKNDGNSSGVQTAVWAQPLRADGSRMFGSAHRLIAADQPWERGVIEAPAMIPAEAGGYWLFSSGGSWHSSSYGTGLAYCRVVTGPCEATSKGPFLATSPTLTSPGGLDTFTDLSGHLWVAFTALKLVPAPWHPGRSYYNRVLDIAPVVSH